MASLTKGSATTSGTKIDQVNFNFLIHVKSFLISEKAWKRKKRIERRKKALKPLSTEPPPPTMNPYRLEVPKFSHFSIQVPLFSKIKNFDFVRLHFRAET